MISFSMHMLAKSLPSVRRNCQPRALNIGTVRTFSSSRSVSRSNIRTPLENQILSRNPGASSEPSPLSAITRMMQGDNSASPASGVSSDYARLAESLEADMMKNPYSDRAPPHHLHVFAHKHNTMITLTRPNGTPLLSLGCGQIGFRKAGRSGFDPAYQLSSHVMSQIQERGYLLDIKQIEVVYRGFGKGRDAFTKVLLGNEGRHLRGLVSRVTDSTRVKFGAPQAPAAITFSVFPTWPRRHCCDSERSVPSDPSVVVYRTSELQSFAQSLADAPTTRCDLTFPGLLPAFECAAALPREQTAHSTPPSAFPDFYGRLDDYWSFPTGPSKTVWMHPLNPFLRAFFRSTVPGQCIPVENHVLLVPTTECLVGSRDRESGLYYSDLVASEEFLGSHVLRIPINLSPANGKEDWNVRDNRGKAKQVTTFNGRTVIIKENSVYSNKGGPGIASYFWRPNALIWKQPGFKSLTQAQLLSDALYYVPSSESRPWLVYYISRPLIGLFDPGRIVPAVVPGNGQKVVEPAVSDRKSGNGESISPTKQEIKSFGELLSHFPMIARQMQPGLDRLFGEFGKELGKPLPPPPSRSPSASGSENEHKLSRAETLADESSSIRSWSSRRGRLPFNSEEYFEDDEDLMRRSLETAVTAAIDLFRLVDKQQLSLLGATTDLTGPLVERLIERYVAEQVHEPLLFPRLCAFRQPEDSELDSRIRHMESIDVTQVGISVEGGQNGKRELIRRLGRGVEEFRKMGDAKGPHDMLHTLLETVKVVSFPGSYDQVDGPASEKGRSSVTVNADVLVSLLLVVVIRSQLRHLQARLLYMQHFIYIDDVDSGEMGYALSTFEAVLMYLVTDSAGLRRASARNRRLWQATKTGKISDMRSILEPNGDHESVDESIPHEPERKSVLFQTDNSDEPEELPFETSSVYSNSMIANGDPSTEEAIIDAPPLSHVFPFQTWGGNGTSHLRDQWRPVKKVSMDVRSLSESSAVSFLSRTTTIGSMASGIEGDSSIETLTKTQDPAGDSIPMMAVQSRQAEALKYLLSLEEYYPLEDILADTNADGTSLLNAAVQLAHAEIVDILLDFLFTKTDESAVAMYLTKSDVHGRTVGHYLFSTPSLLNRLGGLLPWRQRDKHGQTPLFALCRSYDHPEYKSMVPAALTAAQRAQGNGKPLQLDDHVDARGNTLLHIVGDPEITTRILQESDCDPNATNDKKFTPLMMASKYGRVDQVRILFMDPRVDVHVKEARGLTAVELAKDDDVRNRIDDLILLSHPPSACGDPSGRVTTVVRSFFVEDATVRFILKSGAPYPLSETIASTRPGSTTYTVTTCRRSFSDFENLAKWLAVEHPASYVPTLSDFRNPFQVHSKPSRSLLHDLQEKLDRFLKTLLTHPTFSTHEMLWEFFLVPEFQPDMMADRSQRKAAVLTETIAEEVVPITLEGMRDTEQFVSHAQDMVRAVHANTRSLIRRGHALQNSASDIADAVSLCSSVLATLQEPTNALPSVYIDAFTRYGNYLSTSSSDSSPLLQYLAALTSIDNTTGAVLTSLSRPLSLMSNLASTNRTISRSRSSLISSSLPRKFNINFPGFEESRQKSVRDLEQKIRDGEAQSNRLAKEVTWNKDVVIGELAGWTTWREKVGRDAIRAYVKDTLVREKERGKRIERCLRSVREMKS
ncbi:Myosin light chain kinase-like protein [Penicillium hispanicum]|uniref:Myosin light chain kinase-like protein n=1 Tax=Penicillium hispanicum TaxID=1080232 RepID=UPI002541F2F4|nr:Myosin light chain kinase-like protein [Penicillium hispanicum]KAJ5587777.1 Myosin light chain kinase-like protein [Penicillium hispanicum]